MGYWYQFFRPDNFKLINEGKFAGMPFYYSNLPVEIPMISCCEEYLFNSSYDQTGLLSRSNAKKLQSIMTTNKTMFTDMMDEEKIEGLIFRIT